MNLQFMNAAVSADILNATACFPSAPDGGGGATFCSRRNQLIFYSPKDMQQFFQKFFRFINCTNIVRTYKC